MEEIQEVKKIVKKMNQFVVIGLGRFGYAVALSLSELGKEVLAIDSNPEYVRQLEGKVTDAVVADATGNEVLHSLGVQNFDCAIICVGDNLEANILSTLICKDLGVNYVVARASDEHNKKILDKIGADMVIYPELYTGRKLANILSNPSVNELISLSDNFKIVEIPVPDNWQDKTVIDLDVRKKYKVSINFIKREDEVIAIEPETQFQKNDILVVAGEKKYIESISNQTSDVIDPEHTLKDAL